MKQLAITLIVASSLNGCISGAIAGTTAASSITYDERSITTMLEDQNIEHLAAETIKQNSNLKNSNISTNALNHNVLIYGEVTTPQQRTLAARLIKNIPNVKKVYNQLTLATNSSAIDTGKDSWITGKVRLELLKTKRLHSTQVRVVTENKVVYLMGILTQSQQQLAVKATKKVSGVRKVVTLFETVS